MRVSLVAAALALALVAGEARSQMNPLRQLEVTAEDVELLTATADRVYHDGEVGGIARWTNSDSGNAGTAEVIERFERDGLPCRRAEHVMRIAKDPVHATACPAAGSST